MINHYISQAPEKSIRLIRASIASLAFAALSSMASAQFVYDSSHNAFPPDTGVSAWIGDNNGAAQIDYQQSDTWNANGGADVSASATYLDTNYGATHYGEASADLWNQSLSGGILLQGSCFAQDTLETAGGNSFFSGEAVGESGVDEGFTMTSSGTFDLIATATASNVEDANPYGDATSYFAVTLQDRTTGTYLLANYVVDYSDRYLPDYHPINGSVDLVAGDYYELSVGAFAQALVGYPDDPSSQSSLTYNYKLQIGSPTTSSAPAPPAFAGFIGLIATRIRRRSGR